MTALTGSASGYRLRVTLVYRLLLFVLFITSSEYAMAQDDSSTMSLCPVISSIPPRPVVSDPLQQDDIYIIADEMEYVEDGLSIIDGNAELTYNQQQVSADLIEFYDPENRVDLTGSVNYWDNALYLNSPGGQINLDDDTGSFDKVNYWLLGNRGRGNAARILLDLGKRTEGQRVDYTTCDPDQGSPWNLTTNIWKLSAGSLVLNHEDDRGSGTNVILKVKDIPVFYTPYISFPISDRRKSGLLVPTFATSSRYGMEIQTPYYWNIAPEMDATITPRFISESGLMMTGEYRYLMQRGQGELNLEYLPDDSVYDGEDRYSISLQHRQSYLRRGRLALNYNRVSDQDYLEDFSSSLLGTSTRFLLQRARSYYTWWVDRHRIRLDTTVANYQVVDRNIPVASRPYRRLPSTRFTLTSPYVNTRLNYDLAMQFDYFTRGNDPTLNAVNGMRYDIYPSVSYPVNHLSYYIIPKASVRYTSYHLEDNLEFNNRNPDRLVPILSLDSGLIFERDTRILGQDIVQTLEPRLYYLYIPEHDQSDLPIFDTGQFNLNFASLFFENRFNGADRIGDANQVTLAVSSQLYRQDNGQQLGNFSIGQAFYLEDRDVILPGQPVQTDTFSTIIARAELNLFEDVDLRGEFQWDPERQRAQKLALNAQYRPGAGKVINLGYRKHRSEPGARVNNIFDLEQTDVSFRWPVSQEWSVVGKWNFAIEEARSLDLFTGIEYNSCCWGMRIVARRFLSNLAGEYESGVFMQFELKGLAGLGEKTVDFLRTSIPGYENEF